MVHSYSVALGNKGKKSAHSKSVWKVHLSSYIAGIVFFLVTGMIFIFAGIPAINKDIIVVPFSLSAPDADSVSLVGDFNKWDPEETRMKKKDGMWEIKIKLKKGHVYTYNYVINGREWITDPHSLLNVDDGFGGKSSILKL